ncbi:MAG TPA: phosphodiester glycosidase family protein [Ohtaekwangia sp.]|uniref:phosphodiester glycosidase family protein n=1 Tax=Ohtaekwangia sp. TaxID=2066019 RepID=UPI002F95506E
MLSKYSFFTGILFLFFVTGAAPAQENDSKFVSFITDASSIKLYWKDDSGQIFRSIQSLKTAIEAQGKELRFAMNGGMYMKDNSPQGLYIERGIISTPLDTLTGAGNFYLKPNGVFYITKDNNAVVCRTEDFTDNGQVNFATQSGPMLLIDGQVHPAFKKGSVNLNIRNGVGILPDNSVIFAMSKGEVNFYDFAEFFKSMGCRNALYLDGFVSRTYLPEQKWKQLDGNFGAIIGVLK